MRKCSVVFFKAFSEKRLFGGPYSILKTIKLITLVITFCNFSISISVHLWKSLPTSIKNVNIYWSQGCKSFRSTGYVKFLKVCPKETFICKWKYKMNSFLYMKSMFFFFFSGLKNWCILLWSKTLNKKCYVSLWWG